MSILIIIGLALQLELLSRCRCWFGIWNGKFYYGAIGFNLVLCISLIRTYKHKTITKDFLTTGIITLFSKPMIEFLILSFTKLFLYFQTGEWQNDFH